MKIFIYASFILSWLSIPVYPFAPTYVHKKLQEYQLKDEYNPDRWFRLDAQVAMEKLRQKVLSKYVNCDPDDLVILDNVSTAINSILKSLKLCYIIMLHT
ncbi:unnamed protein product [Rotaria magnacalcarata]|uniref:Uncharacterized protein n=1 Tax=Rotaria magnacalcarata TaxID=392030 RepID=A0A816PFC3_9BILA|nr:unnamed protein product [Rotaria magnacalcarata]